MSMVFGPSGRDHDSQNQLFVTLYTPAHPKYFKENSEFKEDCNILEIEQPRNVGKGRDIKNGIGGAKSRAGKTE